MKLSPQERARLLKEFEAAPDGTLFSGPYIAALRDCSIETIERDRWAGTGVPFIKIGRAVRYRKGTALEWTNSHPERTSTSPKAA